jgi:hypothetical protein
VLDAVVVELSGFALRRPLPEVARSTLEEVRGASDGPGYGAAVLAALAGWTATMSAGSWWLPLVRIEGGPRGGDGATIDEAAVVEHGEASHKAREILIGRELGEMLEASIDLHMANARAVVSRLVVRARSVEVGAADVRAAAATLVVRWSLRRVGCRLRLRSRGGRREAGSAGAAGGGGGIEAGGMTRGRAPGASGAEKGSSEPLQNVVG